MSATPSESPTQALYRAALGPLNTERHLQAFARFDDAGVAAPRWNWAAALLTFNWLLYRRLWRMAGGYLLLVGAAVGLVLSLGWGSWPRGVLAGVLGALLVLACVVPGLWAEAWLHRQVRHAMIAAVCDAPSLNDACDALRQRAPSMGRFGAIALFNLLLLAAAFGLYGGGLSLSAEPAQALPAPSATPVVAEPAPAPLPSLPPEPEPEPEPRVVTSPNAPALEPAAAPAPVPVVAPPPPSPPVAIAVAPAPEPPAAPRRGPYVINAGLFAQTSNAERVHKRLREAGLPVTQQTLETAQGTRIRVRVGPWSTRAQADRAAVRIRGMGLEARVVKLE